MAETGQGLSPSPDNADFCLAAMRAVKLTLLDSGLDNDEVFSLFARVGMEASGALEMAQWTSELNKRRFELIDGDIQGKLSRDEQLELTGLTQLMRHHADSEANLPLEGVKKLHEYLTDLDSESSGSGK